MCADQLCAACVLTNFVLHVCWPTLSCMCADQLYPVCAVLTQQCPACVLPVAGLLDELLVGMQGHAPSLDAAHTLP
jgi:hypothetical protein